VLSLLARAPRTAIPTAQLRRMILSAVALYLMGACAWLTHQRVAAAALCAAGTGVATLAAWLSRGAKPDDPPSAPDPARPHPPDDPERRPPEFDWDAFEQAFRAYSEREPARHG
jgi:hypothetical protein